MARKAKAPKVKPPEIEYSIYITQDDSPVRGNVMASGDDALDKEVEDKTIAALDRGDVHRWALVEVQAKIKDTVSGFTFYGKAYLGGCSYDSHNALVKDLFTDDSYGLKGEALLDLHAELLTERRKGEKAAALLFALPPLNGVGVVS